MKRYPNTAVITYDTLGTTGDDGVYYPGTVETLSIECRLKIKPAYPQAGMSGLQNKTQWVAYCDPFLNSEIIPIGATVVVDGVNYIMNVTIVKYQKGYELWLLQK